ncbi:MAG: restriction endonuclease subunit S [Veillonella dispar]|uniref:restriction endonuclease subunit S n=1 Tax=Veillonella dispar TaxID=39778 RepID=UPI00290402B1|nr:restriction endonuclease subunit S [Veillonella dispar]MDU1986856.1 restriction endonuclease subunit S [Veillonella dispar]
MSKGKRRVPKLRFPGFTEDWEQRKLGNLATVEMNKRIFKEQTTTKGEIPFYKIGTFGSDADSFISKELFEEYKNKYPYPNIGDILISASGSIGRTVVYNGEDAYYQDSNIVWLNHNGQIDNSFLLQFYNQVKWAGLEGSTIKRLYNKNILETNIALPKIEEQRLIGKFFKLVDSSITLHQRKLDNLKLKKKALLQKLFPKNGERYPELRFPGFTDAWEQRKFKDLFKERREKTIRENEETLLSCAITGIYLNSDLFSHFRGSSTVGYLKVKKYDLILSAQNLHLGNANINLSFERGMISPAYKVFELKSIDPYFINAWVKKDTTKNFFLKATTEGASQCRKNIEWDVLQNQEIPIPNNLEQIAIGKFINNIDMIITLHQRKLDHLKLQKKALLQQMFV